jgi:IS30 family transposase
MRLTMDQKRAVSGKLAGRYRGSVSRKERSRILDEVVELTSYNRHYAAWLLHHFGKRRFVRTTDDKLVQLVVGRRNKRRLTRRPRKYDEAVKKRLEYIWDAFGLCGKRLKAMMKDILPSLVARARLTADDEVYQKLMEISASTIDRLLKEERTKSKPKGNTHTKPSSLLKVQIPIVISSELNTTQPGHYQIDLVGHDGGNPNGHYAFSLNAVELLSGWIEPRILLNKAQKWTKEALISVKSEAPVPIESVHSDNDSAFINENLQSWCGKNQIFYTRARPYHSNDTCYVEQKNYDIVRQAVGYHRYETEQEVALISELYEKLRLLVNFFYPSFKLLQKIRRGGGRIKRVYDEPKSPFHRLIECEATPAVNKIKLHHRRRQLDPFELKASISRIQDQLIELVKQKSMKILYPGPSYPKATERMKQRLFG